MFVLNGTGFKNIRTTYLIKWFRVVRLLQKEGEVRFELFPKWGLD
jgi:hypothetical protein